MVTDMPSSSAESGAVARSMPSLRASILFLTFIVLLESIAGYAPAAFTDAGTVFFGLFLLRRDLQSVVKCLPTFVFLAGLNFIFQFLTFTQLLTAKPGAAYFFSTDCPISVVKIQNGQETHMIENLCSWHTVLGNIALVFAVSAEYACMRNGWRILKALWEERQSMLSSAGFLDVEGGSSHGSLLRGAHLHELSLQRTGAQGSPQGQVGAAGQHPEIKPFSGQAHRLVDDFSVQGEPHRLA